LTWAEIGVDRDSVATYSGWAYTMERNSATSPKLRRAWIPPAVAQAPIVITRAETARTCWMRSSSSGVVIEPSTRETSYGPSTTARVASGK
jgi:hypothetical protein